MENAKGRRILLPVLLLNLALLIIVLGLAGHFLDEIITGTHSGGNRATTAFVTVSLIAGVVGCGAVLAGLYHLRFWRSETLASANAVTWVSWTLFLLAMGLAWKEIRIGGRNIKHKVLEASVIILCATLLLYILMLHLGFLGRRRQYGPIYEDHVVKDPIPVEAVPGSPLPPAAAAAAASAV